MILYCLVFVFPVKFSWIHHHLLIVLVYAGAAAALNNMHQILYIKLEIELQLTLLNFCIAAKRWY